MEVPAHDYDKVVAAAVEAAINDSGSPLWRRVVESATRGGSGGSFTAGRMNLREGGGSFNGASAASGARVLRASESFTLGSRISTCRRVGAIGGGVVSGGAAVGRLEALQHRMLSEEEEATYL